MPDRLTRVTLYSAAWNIAVRPELYCGYGFCKQAAIAMLRAPFRCTQLNWRDINSLTDTRYNKSAYICSVSPVVKLKVYLHKYLPIAK